MKKLLFVFITWHAAAQPSGELSFSRCRELVERNHPVVRQASAEIDRSNALVLSARGAFDPRLSAETAEKAFEGKTYYVTRDAGLSVPTAIGPELKAGYENNEGPYLNPQQYVPETGLLAFGVKMPLAKGLWTNERRTLLKVAQEQVEISKAEFQLRKTQITFEMASAYYEWKRAYDEMKLYETYANFAQERLVATKGLINAGDKPGIDSVEANITVLNRKLNLEDSKRKETKARLYLSSFLWDDEGQPIALTMASIPEENPPILVDAAAEWNEETHPKMRQLRNKLTQQTLELRLKRNSLLPKLDVGYSVIADAGPLSGFDSGDYKVGLSFSYPILLRKERGDLQNAKAKVRQTDFELSDTRQNLKNKIEAQKFDYQNIRIQNELIQDAVSNYQSLLDAEEKLFAMGESSVFMINSREATLVSSRLSQIALQYRLYQSAADLYLLMANP